MTSETMRNLDVLTVAVLLPESDQDRNALFEYIANNGDIHGGVAMNAMHGNLINYYRVAGALANNEEAEKIMERLNANTQKQVSDALKKLSTKAAALEGQEQQLLLQEKPKASSAGSFKLGLMMFILGALVSYNFF